MKPAAKYIMMLSLFFSTGCASSILKVNSSPESADVYLADEGQQPKKIGQTPVRLQARDLDEANGRFVTLYIKKEGYQSESVMVPTGLINKSVEISSKLEEFKLPPQCREQTVTIEKIARGVAQVQILISSNKLYEAQTQLNLLLSDYPDVSVLQDLMGNVQYINKNLDGALVHYEKSLKIDSNNLDTQRMVTKIKGIIGVRSPASVTNGGQ